MSPIACAATFYATTSRTAWARTITARPTNSLLVSIDNVPLNPYQIKVCDLSGTGRKHGLTSPFKAPLQPPSIPSWAACTAADHASDGLL